MNTSVETLPALDLDVAGPGGPRMRPTVIDPDVSIIIAILMPGPF
ncbi:MULTISPECIES: hypothetical protein [Sphingomonas]|uniref:Uncharacterized protein n=1 Tax=Sphingomonas trueperi TaxID=53317 RepID=A0A7X5XVM1_9SPHN|nr:MULTISPECIES: hypothetical protein [Sphingomonas]NJB95758.1 hypothetical protein [Sphingomonas trueperi]